MQLTHDLGRIHHNTSVTLDHNVSPEFLLVRLAWSIFPLLSKFFEIGMSRNVCLRISGDRGYAETKKYMNWGELSQLRLASDKSTSLKKRKPAFDNVDNQQQDSYGGSTPTLSAYCSSNSELMDLDTLIRRELQEGHPLNPAILCCDYS